MALLFVWQGEPQTLAANATVDTHEGATQEIARGPVASLSSIKRFGTNGGRFLLSELLPPLREPHSCLTDVTQNWLMLLVAPSIVYAFGVFFGTEKQGWALFAACMFLLVASVAIVYPAEQYGNPLLTSVGADQSLTADQGGGGVEGKEVKFG